MISDLRPYDNSAPDSLRRLWVLPAVLVLVNLLAKGAFIGINTGEYTDGILQITALKSRAGLYPPMYEGLSRAVALSGLSLEMAARVVSVVAGALCVLPVYFMGKNLAGRNAALFAAILYTVAPMPWRWSVRVMTDSLFLLLSTSALVMLTGAWVSVRAEGTRKSAAGYFAIATLYGGLATLTRYQGALLAPLFVIVLALIIRKTRRVPWSALAMAGCFAVAAGAWMLQNRFVHGGQFASRTAGSPLATAMAWWNTLESFVLISPYYMGYPIAAAAVLGAFVVRRMAEPWHARPTAILWGAYGLMLLGLQAVFGSFQYRYMMPLLPIVAALGGVGFTWAEAHWRGWLFKGVFLVSICYLVLFSLAVLTLQRETYGDQREAAEFIRRNAAPGTAVFANERYGNFTNLGSVKLSYWSGRPVKVLVSRDQPMPAGSWLALGTAYGGDEAVAATLAALEQNYTLRPLTPQPFRSRIVPLMDDIMTNPMFNQNALAWVLRYVPQNFATQIFEVQPRGAGAGNGA